MKTFSVTEIGRIRNDESGARLELGLSYRQMLVGLEKHSHIFVLWWFSENDNKAARSMTMVHPNHSLDLPLQGVFATRAPMRPNPIALSAARITRVDAVKCVIWIDKTDAFDNSPVIDIKPYVPRLDKIDDAISPDWPKRK